jgi:exonuclease SbcD
MKIFHISDLHIGLKLFEHDLAEDQNVIFRQITELAGKEKPDAIIVAGDIYNRADPSAESVEMFDHFVSGLSEAAPEAEIMMISGNHDSAPRVNTFRSILSRQKIHMIGLPPQQPDEHIEKVTLQDEWGPVNFYLLPFVKPSMVRNVVMKDDDDGALSYDEAIHRLIDRETINEDERSVLVSHQFYIPVGGNPEDIERMDSETITVGNIDAVRGDVLEHFDYAALGHIHKPSCVGAENYRYCGTPLACSVSESGQQKGVVVVDMKEKGNMDIQVLPLHPLREVQVITGTLEEVLRHACDDYVSIRLTDGEDLNVADMQDRIRKAFPYLLEIRREGLRTANYHAEISPEKQMDILELCTSFLGDTDEEDRALLSDVINMVKEKSV